MNKFSLELQYWCNDYKNKMCAVQCSVQGWPDLNQAIKVTKNDFFTFLFFFIFNVLVLFVVHNCRNEAINITKSDFFINIFLLVIQILY